ncbi:MAG: hypothetical protein U5K43_06895 [Halofilum sp. (in: g-proteobacteria)]|nr:hypothetical protein [Halofilum sp. (in: g-proteobacteria)]
MANWFLALPVRPDELPAGLLDDLPAGLRRFDPRDLHVTVAFLGPVGTAAAEAAWDVSAQIEAQAVARVALRAGGGARAAAAAIGLRARARRRRRGRGRFHPALARSAACSGRLRPRDPRRAPAPDAGPAAAARRRGDPAARAALGGARATTGDPAPGSRWRSAPPATTAASGLFRIVRERPLGAG